ncbi:acetate--CoA ligase family protein [Sphaerisporangium sp. NBC_01403]|uniref:acetate--CoA ligase family protein n=1 Tax=Sphaerisporangium sp. NBC_01403 TaxID=2903599 RepID=UPI0032538F69
MTLRVFSDPASVAVVGASADRAKWGYWLARGALRGAHRRRVHLVSRSGAVVEGVTSVPGLAALPEVPELVVLSVPPDSAGRIVAEALDLGVRGFLAITAGVDEAGLAERVRAAGARLVGPNCLGIYDAATELDLAWGNFVPGSLGIVSQSGQLGLELAGLAREAGIGVSRFVSVGNQADVSAREILADLSGHEPTAAVVLYLEAFPDGRELVGTLRRLREHGRPVIVLTVGASEASRAAARSHTGALTAGRDVVEAACRAAGAVLVETPAQAVDLAQLLIRAPRLAGRRVAVIGDSGGQGAVAADVITRAGLDLPELAGAAREMAEALPDGAAVRNPVDLAGAGERDLGVYARLTRRLVDGGEVDAVVLTGYFGSYGADEPSLAVAEQRVVARLGEAVRTGGRPVVVHGMTRECPAVDTLREHGVPVYHTIDAAARALAYAAGLALHPVRPLPPTPPDGHAAPPPQASAYLAARDALAACGVPFTGALPVRDAASVAAAAGRLRAPYALKAAWLEHKSDLGGVVLGLADAGAAAEALAALVARLGQGEYVLEEMDARTGVVELIVGGRQDPSFGPVVLAGLGGVQAELYRDVAVELAPVTPAQALEMLRGLRGHALLTGWRGRPPVALEAVAEAVAAVSRLVAGRPDVVECEVNPLRAAPDGVLAVDALAVFEPGPGVFEPEPEA